MDLGVISFPWHDIYALKGPIMARSQLGTGHPSDPVTQRFSCEVFQVDIIPSFQTISSRDGFYQKDLLEETRIRVFFAV